MKRKIIQISSCRTENTYHTQAEFMVFALCNDGSVWEITNSTSAEWSRLPQIPQGFTLEDEEMMEGNK